MDNSPPVLPSVIDEETPSVIVQEVGSASPAAIAIVVDSPIPTGPAIVPVVEPSQAICELAQFAEVKPTRRKPSAKKKPKIIEKKKTKKGRGRPAVYVGAVRREIVRLVRAHGATGARKHLAARAGRGDRNVKIIAKPLNISMPTLLKFAGAAGVKLHRGRPAKAA